MQEHAMNTSRSKQRERVFWRCVCVAVCACDCRLRGMLVVAFIVCSYCMRGGGQHVAAAAQLCLTPDRGRAGGRMAEGAKTAVGAL